MRCPGSVQAEAPFADRAGVEAAEGTAFHWLMATCLRLGLDPEDFLDQSIQVGEFAFVIDHDMCRFGRPGLDWINGLMTADSGWELHVEVRVDISPWTRPGEIGTSDVVLMHRANREMLVWDWKYGSGTPVYPGESWQLKAYALGAWRSLFADRAVQDPEKVTLHIEQPRYPGAGGSVEMSFHELFNAGMYAAGRARLALTDDAPREPGETQCRFCRAAPTCGAFAKWNLEMLGMDFDALDDGPPRIASADEVTPERRSAILLARPLIEKWLDTLHASAYRDAELGHPVPGMKLVEGRRPPRRWIEAKADEVETVLVAELDSAAWTEPKLISPTTAQKLLRGQYQDAVAHLVEQGNPKPVLVGVDDRRPAIQSAADELDNLDEKGDT